MSGRPPLRACILLFVLGTGAGPATLRAATWFVAPAGKPEADGTAWERALASPAEAARRARSGDEIWLQAGTYLLTDALTVADGVALRGGFAGRERHHDERRAINFAHETVLRQTRPGAGVVVLRDARHVRLDGLTLTGADGAAGLALENCDATVSLAWLRVTRNTAAHAGAGIRVLRQSAPQVFNCQISENATTGDAGGAGLFIDETSAGTWEFCIVNGNRAGGAHGGGASIATRPEREGPRFVRGEFYFNEAGASGSALDLRGRVELRDTVVCSNLARDAQPGLPLRLHGPGTRVRLTGETYVVGNVAGASAPQHAAGIDGSEWAEIGPAAIVVTRDTGPAEPELLGRRDDVHTILHDVFPPALTTGEPTPGTWVRQTHAEYRTTAAYHTLYLPTDWQPGRTYPVLAGFPGNGPYRNRFGDRSGGRPEDNPMGIGLTAGRGFIVIGFGYLDSRARLKPTERWWGDVPATIAYTQAVLDDTSRRFGGDAQRVLLYGFSRSAIGASFIGLHDDAIAARWRAFLCYDGWETQRDMARDWYGHGKTSFNYDPQDFGGTGVARRFARVNGRPIFILGGNGSAQELNAAHGFPVTLMPKPHRNHHTSWALRGTPEREAVRRWLAEVAGEPVAGSR
jgi:hypothetical protein